MTTDAIHAVGGIGDWLAIHADRTPHAEALSDSERRLDCATLDRRVNRLAHALAARGLRKGDRLCAVMLNSVAFIETVFACARLGAVFVPINFRLSPPEVLFILRDAGAHILIHDAVFAPLVASIRDEAELLHVIEVGPGGAAGAEVYEDLCAGIDLGPPETPVSQHDPHVMMYTSGTTGRPKGALLTHANTTWNAFNLLLSEGAPGPDDVVLTVAPMFHIGGLNIHSLPALYKGTRLVLRARFDPRETLRTIAEERITMLFLVPAMWLAISQLPDFDDHDLSSLRLLLSGGAPTPITLIEFFQSRGFAFLEGFGMTETAPNACFLGSKDAVRKNGSVGQPVAHVRMRVVDEADRELPRGEVGELVLRGPNLFIGYWNRPEATEEAFRGGWFHSGDLARQDEEGFFYIVDRKKDMFISGGENVYPAEVEHVLYRHPKVQEVAVIGVPDERWGEVGLMVAVTKPGVDLSLGEITAFCEGRLAHFKIPRRLVLVEALARNATGKLLKHEMRRVYGTA